MPAITPMPFTDTTRNTESRPDHCVAVPGCR